MTTTYWESLYSKPPLSELERCDGSSVLEWIAFTVPVCGSKIDWSRVQGKHLHRHVDDNVALAFEAAALVAEMVTSRGRARHAGDGLSPFGVVIQIEDVTDAVPAILEIPEHHYFLAEDRSWLMVVTTEGDLDVLELGDGTPPLTGTTRPGTVDNTSNVRRKPGRELPDGACSELPRGSW